MSVRRSRVIHSGVFVAGMLVAALGPGVASPAIAAVAGLGTNLIENGNFEAQTANPGWNFANHAVLGWEDGGTYDDTTAGSTDTPGKLIDYVDNSDSEFVSNTAATQLFAAPSGATVGPEGTLGANYLYSGEGGPGIAGSQTIDLTGDPAVMAAISGGNARFSISGWFGGWDTQTDRTDLTANFYSGMGDLTDTVTIGNVAPGDRGNSRNAWVYREDGGTLPAGTRSIEFVLATAATAGGHSGVADNLSFSVIPEPSTATLLASFMAILLTCKRRR